MTLAGLSFTLRPSTAIAALSVAAMLAYALGTADPYGLRVLTIAGVYALNVVGYQFIFGHAGALSLAQGTFFGIGAYTTALLSLHVDLDFAATFPASIVAATLLALVVAVPVLRLETHYLALATLAISQLAILVATNWESLTGGANGLPSVPGITLFGHAFGRGLPTFTVVWVCVGIGVAVAAAILTRTRRLRFHLQRERPLAAAAIGLDRFGLRLAALLLSAAYGGAAGALYVHTNRVISPDALAFSILVLTLAMTVIGGRLSLAGALVAGLLLTLIPEWFRFLDRYYLLAYGAAMLAVVVFAPNGLAALADRIAPRAVRPVPVRPAEARADTEVQTAPTGSDAPALALSDLCKRFGGLVAVDIAQLRIPAGQICGLIGPNGSGKTTLLNLISGFERADSGSVSAFGADITRQPAHTRRRHGIARCFQQPMLLGGRSAIDNVAVALAGGGGTRAAHARAAHLLEQCGLRAESLKPTDALSFGHRRLVEVARALAGRPRLVLLDEPAAGLGEDDLGRLAELIRATRAVATTWVIVDHNFAFLASLADRLICLDAGTPIADDAPDAVLAHPAVRRAYFGVTTGVEATP